MKRLKRQLVLFSAPTQTPTWLTLPEAQRMEIVDRIARLIARAAKPHSIDQAIKEEE